MQLRRAISPLGFCNHFWRGVRRLNACRYFYDMLGDQSRSGSHLQHCFVFRIKQSYRPAFLSQKFL